MEVERLSYDYYLGNNFFDRYQVFPLFPEIWPKKFLFAPVFVEIQYFLRKEGDRILPIYVDCLNSFDLHCSHKPVEN